MVKRQYLVPNISCGHCVMTIERELKEVQGLTAVKAEEDSKIVTVEVEAPAVLAEVKSLLAEIGYPAEKEL